MVNLVLKPDLIADSDHGNTATAEAGSKESSSHHDDSLITPEDLGLETAVHSRSQSPSLLRLSSLRQSPRSIARKPSPGLNAHLPLDSDDSVQDPPWPPLSKKIRHLSFSSDSGDEVPLSSLRTNDLILPTDDEIEHQVRSNKKQGNTVQKNRKARVLGEAYLGFKKIGDDAYKPCV